MRIVLLTHSSDPEFDGDCECAVVELTPALLDQIRSRVRLADQACQQDGDLHELAFWGGTAEFYDRGLLEACEAAVAGAASKGDPGRAVRDWIADLEQQGHALLPGGVEPGVFTPQRTEADRMVVGCRPTLAPAEFPITWTASPKHTDVCITTWDLTISVLEAYIRGEARVNQEETDVEGNDAGSLHGVAGNGEDFVLPETLF